MADRDYPQPRRVEILDGPSMWDLILGTFEKDKQPTVRFTLKTQWVSLDAKENIQEESHKSVSLLEILEIRVWGKTTGNIGLLLRTSNYSNGKPCFPASTVIDIENYSVKARRGSGLVRQR